MILEDNRYNALPVEYGAQSTLPPARSLKSYYPRVVVQPKTDFTGAAWASVWNARTAAEAIACNQTDQKKITEIAFSPAYNYGLVRKTQDCLQAVSIIDLLESLVKNGSPYFSEFREFCPIEVTADLYSLARSKKLSGYFKLFNTTDEMKVKVQSVKNAINSSNAVIAGMICPPSFHFATDFWQPREPQADPQYGGHAVCVVGYDDTKFGGSFEVVNTWGKDWGVQGYTWIRYKDFGDYFPYAFGLFQVGSASCNIPFEAKVVFNQINGEEMRVQVEGAEGQYKFWKPYPTGTTFTIQMTSAVPAYVYCFGVDPANELFPLFPRLSTTVPISFSLLRAPDDMPAITLTDPPGKNNVYFIFSPSAIDLTKTIAKLKGRKIITPNDVRAALSSTAPSIKWSNKDLSFSGSLTGAVVMQVLLEQTKK
ncbi:MAG: DUF4384 domain-containing protein [Bacteroidota bacterium]